MVTTTALALAFVALGSGLDEPPSQPLAKLYAFDELKERMKQGDLRILDARPRAEFDAGHLPMAMWVDAKEVERRAAKPGALADREGWEEWIAPLALAPTTEVVVYDDNRQLDAARIWWLLSYLGVAKVGLVDGGYKLWVAEGHETDDDMLVLPHWPFTVQFRTERHADREAVAQAIAAKSAQVVDARSEAEHTGTRKMSRKGGHIPGAWHLEWSNLVDAQGRFLDPSALKAKLAEAGVKPGEPIITHCQGGGRASVNAFALESLGIPTRNYYLGWSDWGNADDTPVVEGPEKP